MGRPSSYSDKVADQICERLIEGESLVQICADGNMPSRVTVYRWMEANPGFETKCARAREGQADYMDHLIWITSRDCTPESANADRVRLSGLQWRASKLAPKKYGERSALELGGSIGHRHEDALDALDDERSRTTDTPKAQE